MVQETVHRQSMAPCLPAAHVALDEGGASQVTGLRVLGTTLPTLGKLHQSSDIRQVTLNK
jgi:hypothetical protein